MKFKLWFIASFLVLVLGIVCLAWHWHGTAKVSLAIPLSSTSVQFCGSASGGLPVAGLGALLLAILLFIIAVFSWVFSGSKPQTDAAAYTKPTSKDLK